MLRAGWVSFGVTVRTASLAGYRRMVWSADEGIRAPVEMARRVGTAPTFPGFGVLRIACLPPPS